jgi:hypothetical protein
VLIPTRVQITIEMKCPNCENNIQRHREGKKAVTNTNGGVEKE